MFIAPKLWNKTRCSIMIQSVKNLLMQVMKGDVFHGSASTLYKKKWNRSSQNTFIDCHSITLKIMEWQTHWNEHTYTYCRVPNFWGPKFSQLRQFKFFSRKKFPGSNNQSDHTHLWSLHAWLMLHLTVGYGRHNGCQRSFLENGPPLFSILVTSRATLVIGLHKYQ